MAEMLHASPHTYDSDTALQHLQGPVRHGRAWVRVRATEGDDQVRRVLLYEGLQSECVFQAGST